MMNYDHHRQRLPKSKAYTINWYSFQTLLLLLGFLCVVVAGVVLRSARSVVMPLVIAWLFSFIFKPAIHKLEEKEYPEVLLYLCFLRSFLLFVYWYLPYFTDNCCPL